MSTQGGKWGDVLATLPPATTKAQNVAFLATPITIGGRTGYAGVVRLEIAGTAVKVQVSFDNGTTWDYINNGAALTANVLWREVLEVKNGDILNFRTDNVAGITLDRFVVEQPYDESQ